MKVIKKDHHIYSFRPDLTSVESIESGEIIEFETYDSYRDQLKSEIVDQYFKLEGVNPATGPVFVKGAERGDTIKITIISLKLEKEGTMYLRPGAGVLKGYVDRPEVKKMKIENKRIIYNDDFSFPIRPMIGVIGVGTEEEISTFSPGQHGGNMDTKEITEGAILYLPVLTTGANLAIGDFHAIMGDGEVPICGVEIGGRVTVKVEVIKEKISSWPILEDSKNYYLMASAKTLDEATQLATESMFLLLKDKCSKFSVNDVIRLMGIVGDLRISQVVNPLKTAKFVVPKDVFKVNLGEVQ
ncbi:acetamidase/formamidase family protein [Mesobacillus harenae]|uniref:acetamidase/formamidase family protein n=1 Tax=Mesobacillus harenae TaxID=2213203 RepID=UPI00157FBF97